MSANAIERTIVERTVDSPINTYHSFGKRIDNLSFNAGTNQLKRTPVYRGEFHVTLDRKIINT